jgi:homoserine kinase
VVNGPSLVGRAVAVEAPATIANLGAGYDTLGLAVDMALSVSVEAWARDGETPEVELEVEGEGKGALPASRSNRLVVALEAGLRELGVDDLDSIAWRISLTNPIPLERGLGSSAAATVAGLVAAWALVGDDLERTGALRLATTIEGHPDNVAPALFGGLTASIALEDRVETVRIDPPTDVAILAWIPERRLATSEMRRVLPDSVPRADAVSNLARVAVGVAGLASGRSDVLALLTQDRLHEPSRAGVYEELPALIAAARDAGAIGACLAGAGSTVIAFVPEDTSSQIAAVGRALRAEADSRNLPGRLTRLSPNPDGARVTSRAPAPPRSPRARVTP